MPVVSEFPLGAFCPPGLCSENAEQTKAFYEAVLGWTSKDMHMDGGDFTMFLFNGEFVAGMYQMPDARKAAGVKAHWNSYIKVADAQAFADKATELGGKVTLGPFDAMGDLMVNIEDPQGAKFSAWQIRTKQDPALVNDLGALCWSELFTSDSAAAISFYTQLLGWKAQPFDSGPVPYTVLGQDGNECGGFGGILQITEEMQGMSPQWIPYFMTDNIDQVAENIARNGGQIHGPMTIPTVGRILTIIDPQNAISATIQPDPKPAQ